MDWRSARSKLQGVISDGAPGFWIFAIAIVLEAYWRLDDAAFSDTWAEAAALHAMLLPAWLIMVLRDRLIWPLRRYRSHYRHG